MIERAFAKVNLALHVTGRRADGYHLLDSIVCFPDLGDTLFATPSPALSLAVEGPFAAAIDAGPENLVLRAAALLAPEAAGLPDGRDDHNAPGLREGRGARLILQKSLPVAAGIGGGSADAAAALRLLARLWDLPLPAPEAVAALGADIPACLLSRPLRMQGIGERLAPVDLPPFWIVLANPGRPVPTPAVFTALTGRDNPPLPDIPARPSTDSFFAWLAGGTRNDLESPARVVEPAIGAVLSALAVQPGCRLARMSGSGATCFGLFAARAEAEAAATALARAEPGWWIAAAPGESRAP